MKKILYFEGAGWFGADISRNSDLGNCRIRTAFTNNDGKHIYLEMGNQNRYNEKGKSITDQALRIDHLFYITGDHDNCNISRISFDWTKIRELDYTRENIINWINENLNCSFDGVQVLPDLAGYRVHGEKHDTYNYGDTFEYDEALTVKNEEIRQYYYNLEKSEGKQYPNFSLWVDENNKNLLHLLRHYNGYNKHWSIYTDGEGWTTEETILGKYAC